MIDTEYVTEETSHQSALVWMIELMMAEFYLDVSV